MRLVFCGTPDFAVPTLRELLRAGHDVSLVLTQPDRPSGRGLAATAPPLKRAALEAGLRVEQPEKIRQNAELRALLTAIAPEAIIVVAYGRIIPQWMLDLPPHGNINLHGSLLPRYRGAAPIQWAIANGEAVTGATTMRIDAGLDTGDMLLQRELPLAPDQTAEDVFPLLAAMGAPLMAETLDGLAAGRLRPRPQNHAEATLAPMLTREDGKIDFARTALTIYNRWRGFQPWPGAYTQVEGRKLTLHHLLPTAPDLSPQAPGTLHIERGRAFAACGEGTWIELPEVQMEGRKRMPAADFLRGQQLRPDMRLGA